MKPLLIFFLSFFVAVISLQAQTDITVVRKTRPDHLLKKILVLSMVKNYENRKTVENEITWWINDMGFTAYSCNKLQKNEDLPSTELIKSLVEDNGFDGVLISELVDVQMKERYENNPDRNRYNPTIPTYYNVLDAYNYNTKSFEINTKLFEVNNNDILFESNSNTYESTDLERSVESYGKAMAKILKRSKILGKRQ